MHVEMKHFRSTCVTDSTAHLCILIAYVDLHIYKYTNKVTNKVTGSWRKFHREGFHNSCFSSSIEIRNAYSILGDFGLPPRSKRVLRVSWLLIEAALKRRSRPILVLLRSVVCVIRNFLQVSTKFVSLQRQYGQMKQCYYRQTDFMKFIVFYMNCSVSTHSNFGWNRKNKNKHFAWSHAHIYSTTPWLIFANDVPC